MQPIAFVREVTESFSRCVTRTPAVPPLDFVLARRQHLVYRAALEAGGFEVVVVPGDEAHPDGCFIEDAAVVIGDTALIARSGHPSRRGEAGPVAEALAGHFAVEHLDDGTLDGGDVLQMGRTVFVGTGGRTDPAGARRLAVLAAQSGKRLVEVTVRDALHLKSGVTAIDDETVLWHPAACDRRAFDGLRVVEVEGADPEAANVVRLADRTILAGAGRDAVADQIAGLGYEVIACDTSEFARADGGMTCLSIRVR
ncbi:MAG: arginine deiminase family protein [Acidimicrobiia bacterium]